MPAEPESAPLAAPGMLATAAEPSIPGPFRLLLQVNLLQVWRKVSGLRQQSPLLTVLIGLFLIGYAALAFTLFHKGLRFAGGFPGLGPVLLERMLFLLFACLFALLLLSNLIISYTNLFRNREVFFLLPQPVPPQVIFRWKFLESTLLASWAFLFLIAPLLSAYGLTREAAWHFYPATAVFIALFIVLPAVAGAWVAVATARFLDRRTFQVAALSVAAALVGISLFYFRPDAVTDEELETRVLVVLDRLLVKTRFAQYPLLPSYWLSAGVQGWADGARTAAMFFGAVLLSHVLFFGGLMFTRMGDFFYAGVSAVQSRASLLGRWGWLGKAWRRRGPGRWDLRPGFGERLLGRVPGLPADVRALILKDARMFWRDTTQWGQTLVLFGLLTVYFMNLRHFSQQLTNPFWIVIVSYLNLGACSLNLATLTTRFVYPQFSLEGKRLWIVGMAPLGLPRVMLTKFAMTTTVSLALTGSLILLSCRMLQLGWDRTLYHTLSVVVMAFTLNGLATGTGVLYPNLKEDNPGRIVSGFGGTFCLVLSFLYIVASVLLLAVGSPWAGTGQVRPGLTIACWLSFALLSALLGWLPMQLARQRVRVFET